MQWFFFFIQTSFRISESHAEKRGVAETAHVLSKHSFTVSPGSSSACISRQLGSGQHHRGLTKLRFMPSVCWWCRRQQKSAPLWPVLLHANAVWVIHHVWTLQSCQHPPASTVYCFIKALHGVSVQHGWLPSEIHIKTWIIMSSTKNIQNIRTNQVVSYLCLHGTKSTFTDGITVYILHTQGETFPSAVSVQVWGSKLFPKLLLKSRLPTWFMRFWVYLSYYFRQVVYLIISL